MIRENWIKLPPIIEKYVSIADLAPELFKLATTKQKHENESNETNYSYWENVFRILLTKKTLFIK